MKDIFLLFPIHLFSNINELKDKEVYLVEDKRFFTDFKYHKLKLAYHRASMKSYYDFIKSNGIDVKYIEYKESSKKIGKFPKGKNIFTYDLCDNPLKERLIKLFNKNNNNFTILKTHNFLVDEDLIEANKLEFYSEKSGKYNHQNFYKWQRIRLDILVQKNGKPVGGKWSFDEENRQKMPSNVKIPKMIDLDSDGDSKREKYIKEAIEYVEKNFSRNYGSLDNFIYPIDHDDSVKWLRNFLKNKFDNFGIYEDAVTDRDPFLFHSVLSPMMNIGLITDREVIEETLKYQDKVPINSFEGFIRQVIGWRNYIYAVYLLEGDSMKKMNFMKHKRRINREMMWEGKTGILPIDNIIHKIVDYSYAHHIERLMYLGNYMFLCMIKPDDVYDIFMEWTIDAYEWVMIPNVYGMTQFADGGKIMTRPYFASSNYILNMSDYKKDEWCDTLNDLYYNFINHHKDYLSKNYSTARQVAFWKKKSKNEQKEIIQNANKYLKLHYKGKK